MKKAILIFAATAVAGAAMAATHSVTVVNNEFQPQTLANVKVGDMVVWNFTIAGHTTASGSNCTKDNKWDSGLKGSGESFSFTFTSTGEYPYFCEPHCGMGMTGIILVSAAAGMEAVNEGDENTGLANYPNPFSGITSFTFFAKNPGQGLLKIWDVQGREYMTVRLAVVTGKNLVPLALDSPGGMYVARLELDAALPDTRMIMKQE